MLLRACGLDLTLAILQSCAKGRSRFQSSVSTALDLCGCGTHPCEERKDGAPTVVLNSQYRTRARRPPVPQFLTIPWPQCKRAVARVLMSDDQQPWVPRPSRSLRRAGIPGAESGGFLRLKLYGHE